MAPTKYAWKKRASTFHDGKILSAQEEAVIRFRNGIKAVDDEVLTRKTEDPELLARLLELEQAIMKKAHARTKTSES